MKITDIFKTNQRTFSFEFFPPKDEISAVDFGINVGQLLKLNPSFVSVTYGAGGSNQERTFALVNYLQNKIGLQTMAHYTCVNTSKAKVLTDMQQLEKMGIENLMVLRGDPPNGETAFRQTPDGFANAGELIRFIRSQNFAFCMGGGAYPEKHPEAATMEEDIANLKKKCAAGAEFLMSQLFFDNAHYFSFIEKCRAAGIDCRIIPGILPITNATQRKRFTAMGHTSFPPELDEKTKLYENDPKKMYQVGVDFAIAQCRELLAKGAPGLHFYTLNKSRATVEIFETLQK